MKALTFLKITLVVNVLVATGFSIAGMVNPSLILPPNVTTDKAIMIFALYAGARTIPLAILGIISVFGKHPNSLITLATLAGIIQIADGFIGIYQHDLSKTAGPLVIGIIQFVAIYLVMRSQDRGVVD